MVEETGVPGENPQPRESNWQTLPLVAASQVNFFVIDKAGREPMA